MSREVLKDAKGRTIGTIEITGSGIKVLRDHRGIRLGEYDPRSNVTKDASGRRVGSGDLLASLLKERD